ncbi:MAG: RHS repeat-associated core domain-containing protein, partial [Myxococcales bacterium]
DLNGNMTADGTNSYAWNVRNQLTSLTPDGGTADSFVYDGLGRRQTKVINGAETDFLWDQNGNLAAELTPTSQGEVVTAIDLEGLSPDEMVCRYTTDSQGHTEPLEAMTDINGSVIGLIADGGVIQASYAYEPYGQVTATGTDNGNSQQYTGRENDGTGLYYYRARYFYPATGRFISEDPAGSAGANLFEYAGDSPVQYSDPTGLYRIVGSPCPGAVAAQAAALASAGCTPNGTPIACNQCQQALSACGVNAAAVCACLVNGQGPTLSNVASLGGDTGGQAYCAANAVTVITSLCGDPETLVHECIHIATGCTDTGPGGDNNPGQCGSYDLARACGG